MILTEWRQWIKLSLDTSVVSTGTRESTAVGPTNALIVDLNRVKEILCLSQP